MSILVHHAFLSSIVDMQIKSGDWIVLILVKSPSCNLLMKTLI